MDIHIFTDLHYSSTSTKLQSYFAKICQSLQAEPATMLICMGDINTQGNIKDLRWLKERFSQKQPFYYVVGNHDTMKLSKHQIEQVMDTPRYYKVEMENVTMLMLDSVIDENQGDWSGHMDEEQLTWLDAMVKQVPPSNLLLLFSHHPLKDTVARSSLENLHIVETPQIQAILQQYQGTGIFFNGHNHMNDYVEKGNWHYVGLGDVPDIMAYLRVHVEADKVMLSYHPLAMEKENVEDGIAHYQHLPEAENHCYFEDIEIEVQS